MALFCGGDYNQRSAYTVTALISCGNVVSMDCGTSRLRRVESLNTVIVDTGHLRLLERLIRAVPWPETSL